MSKPTPRPWIAYDMGNGMRVVPKSIMDDLIPNISATKNEIAFLKPTAGNNEWSDEMWEIQKSNAAHLVKCVNMHDELVASCHNALSEIDEVLEKLMRVRKSFRSLGGELRCDDVEMKLNNVQNILREALVKAEGGNE